jgi:hypothetical protein
MIRSVRHRVLLQPVPAAAYRTCKKSASIDTAREKTEDAPYAEL